MKTSYLIASPMLLLQLCISNLRHIFTSVFSKVFNWTLGVCIPLTSSVSQLHKEEDQSKEKNATAPTSVNYHFTRQCNYKCGFCFHTAKTSFVLPLDEAKRGLKLLKESGRLHFKYQSIMLLFV